MQKLWRNPFSKEDNFIYFSVENPSDAPLPAEVAAERIAESDRLSDDIASGIASGTGYVDYWPDQDVFRLADPFNNTTDPGNPLAFSVPKMYITNAEQAREVVAAYRQLFNNDQLDIYEDEISYLEDPDGNADPEIIAPERLYELIGLEPLGPAGPAPVEDTEPARQAATGLTYDPTPEPGMDTSEPLDLNAADLVPPQPEAAPALTEAEILQAIQDPSTPLTSEALPFLEDYEIVERLILYPEENAALQEALTEQLLSMNGGTLSRSDSETLAERSYYFMMSRTPNAELTEDQLADQLFGLGRVAQGIEAVEGSRLDEAQIAQLNELLGEADTATFLENRPAHETAAETMAVARSLSILRGRAAELQPEIDQIPGRLTAVQNGEVGPDTVLTTWGRGYNQYSELQAVRRLGDRLQEQQTAYETAYSEVLNGQARVSDEAIRELIDEAQAAISGDLLAAQAEDDGLEATEVSPEDQERLNRGRTFIDAFAQFRSGRNDLYDQAYQYLNNNDVEGVEAIIEEMLDASVRHWWHNMWGSEEYETGELDISTGRAGTELTQAERDALTGANIMQSQTALAQALKEIEAFDEAERVMLQTTQAELTAEEAETTEAEQIVLNRFHDQLFIGEGENTQFNFDSPAALSAATSVDALILRLETVDPIGAEAIIGMRDDLIVSQASSAVFENVVNNYLEENPDNVGGLNHMMELYSDMTGIGGEWNNFSDQNLTYAREAGLFVGGFLIPVGAITGMLARIGKTVSFARQAATARVTSGINRFLQMPMDEMARVRGLTTALRNGDDIPTLMAAARSAGTNTDEVLTAAMRAGSSMDEVYAATNSMDDFLRLATRAGNRGDEMLQVALRNGAQLDALQPLASLDDIMRLGLESGRSLDEIYALAGNMDDFIRVAAQFSDRSDEVLQFVIRNGADMDHLATLGASFDDILRLSSQTGRLDDALVFGLQSGRASIDDLYRYAGSNLDEVVGAARQAGWNADDALVLAINRGTNADRVLEVARAAGSNLDDLAMQAMLQGGRVGQPFNGARIAEIVRANDGNVDEFMRVAQVQGATPQALSAVGRAMGYSDDMIARVLNVTDNPTGSFTAPAMGVVDDGLGAADDLIAGAADNAVPIRPGVPVRPAQPLGIADEALGLADDIPAQTLEFTVGSRNFTRGERVLYQTADGRPLERYIVGLSDDGGLMLRHTPLDDALMRANTPTDELYRASQMRVLRPEAIARITRFDDIPVPQPPANLNMAPPVAPRIVASGDTPVPRPANVPAAPRVNPSPLASVDEARGLPRISGPGPRPQIAAAVVPPLVVGGAVAAETLTPEIDLEDTVPAPDLDTPDPVEPPAIEPEPVEVEEEPLEAPSLEDPEVLPTRRSISVTATNLRFRSTPGLEGEILGQFNPDDGIQIADEDPITADGYVWQKVTDSEGNEGYIAIEDEAQTVQYAVVNEYQGESPEYDFNTPVNVSTRVSFRTGPGTGNDRMGYINPGENITTTGRTHEENGYIWAEVKNEADQQGWMALSTDDGSSVYAEIEAPSS